MRFTLTALKNECNIENTAMQYPLAWQANRVNTNDVAECTKMLMSGTVMNSGVKMRLVCLFATLLFATVGTSAVLAQDRPAAEDASLGPVVSAYLGYLRNEQEVVDDRVSRREISRAYYRRNSNRIRALREMAIRIAHESKNDYLPELEAVAGDEFGTLFEHPPAPASLRVGEVLNFTLRYL